MRFLCIYAKSEDKNSYNAYKAQNTWNRVILIIFRRWNESLFRYQGLPVIFVLIALTKHRYLQNYGTEIYFIR